MLFIRKDCVFSYFTYKKIFFAQKNGDEGRRGWLRPRENPVKTAEVFSKLHGLFFHIQINTVCRDVTPL